MSVVGAKHTPIAVGKCSQETAAYHEQTAGHNGRSPPIGIGHVRCYEEGQNGPNVEHVDQDGQFAIQDRIPIRLVPQFGKEKVPPQVYLL